MSNIFSQQALSDYILIWKEMKQGLPYDSNSEEIVSVLKAHPEFDPFWEQGEAALHPQEVGDYVVSPLIHTRLHVVIETQLLEQDPDEVIEAFNLLVQKGETRHKAIHRIASLWGDIYFKSIREATPFSDWSYVEGLRSLVRQLGTEV